MGKKVADLPKVISINGKDYTLAVKKLSRPSGQPKEETFGLFSEAHKSITLTSGMTIPEQQHILFHELIHLSFAQAEWHPRDEERVCVWLQGWLLDVLRENPALAKFLLS